MTYRLLALTAAVLLAGLASTAACSADPGHPGWHAPDDAAELERFVDPIFAEQMERQYVPGAVFVLVNGDRV